MRSDSKTADPLQEYEAKLKREIQFDYDIYKTQKKPRYQSKLPRGSIKSYHNISKSDCQRQAEHFSQRISRASQMKQNSSKKLPQLNKKSYPMFNLCVFNDKRVRHPKSNAQIRSDNEIQQFKQLDMELYKQIYLNQLSRDHQIVVKQQLNQQKEESIILSTVQKADVDDFLRKRQLKMGTLRKCLRNCIRLQIMHASYIDIIKKKWAKSDDKIFQAQLFAVKEHKKVLEEQLSSFFLQQKEQIMRKYQLPINQSDKISSKCSKT